LGLWRAWGIANRACDAPNFDLGEVTAIEVSIAAANQKLTTMRQLAAKHTTVHLGMSDFRSAAARSTVST
jgi:hypothetical protein